MNSPKKLFLHGGSYYQHDVTQTEIERIEERQANMQNKLSELNKKIHEQNNIYSFKQNQSLSFQNDSFESLCS